MNRYFSDLIAPFSLIGLVSLSPVSTSALTIFNGSVAPEEVNQIRFSDPEAGRVAEDFIFSNTATASKISFLGGYSPSSTPLNDSFTLIFYNSLVFNNGPNSLSIIAQINLGDVQRVDTGATFDGIELYNYTATFDGPSFLAGKMYWVSVLNNTSADVDDSWVWAGREYLPGFGPPVDGMVALSGTSPPWVTHIGKYSFILEGMEVPEPGSLPFLVMSFAAISLYRRGRKPQAARN